MNEKENKSCTLIFRITQSTHDRLLEEAEGKNLTISKYLNSIIDKHFESQKLRNNEVNFETEQESHKQYSVYVYASVIVFFLGLIITLIRPKNLFHKHRK